MSITKAKLRTLIGSAVNDGAECANDRNERRLSHSEYIEALEFSADAFTDQIWKMINKEQNDE